MRLSVDKTLLPFDGDAALGRDNMVEFKTSIGGGLRGMWRPRNLSDSSISGALAAAGIWNQCSIFRNPNALATS